jgi:hypothetical protein
MVKKVRLGIKKVHFMVKKPKYSILNPLPQAGEGGAERWVRASRE